MTGIRANEGEARDNPTAEPIRPGNARSVETDLVSDVRNAPRFVRDGPRRTGVGSTTIEAPIQSSPRAWATAAADLFVSLQIHHPSIRTILVSAVDCPSVETFTAALAERAASIANPVIRLHVQGFAGRITVSSNVDTLQFEDPQRMMDVAFVRRSIHEAAAAGLVVASTSDFLAVHESRVLAASVDGVVILALAGATRERDLRETKRQLTDLGATLLGSVLMARRIQ